MQESAIAICCANQWMTLGGGSVCIQACLQFALSIRLYTAFVCLVYLLAFHMLYSAQHVSVGLLVSPGLLFLVVFVMLYIGSSRGHDCRVVHKISFLVTRRNM